MIKPPSTQSAILRELYPELGAGGFTAADGTVQFYLRINALLDADMTVVDYGAGRGEWTTDPVVFRRNLRMLRGKVAEVIGVDVDSAVRRNTSVDRAVLSDDFVSIPLPDASVDMLVADHTFEHIDDPGRCAQEMARVVKPGGWICARTPNRWGYIALATSLLPNRTHVRALTTVQPDRRSEDVFPTRYRLNTLKKLQRYFPDSEFDNYSYFWAGEPSYFGRSSLLAQAMRQSTRVLPTEMQPKLLIFLNKRSDQDS